MIVYIEHKRTNIKNQGKSNKTVVLLCKYQDLFRSIVDKIMRCIFFLSSLSAYK